MKVQERRGLERRLVLGVLLGLGAGLSYGAGSVLTRMVVTEWTTPPVAAVYSVFFGMAGLFFVGMRGLPRDLRAPRRALAYVMISGVFSSLGVLFFNIALSQAPVSVVSPVAAVNPLIALLFSYLFLRSLERVTWRTVVGALLVVGGVGLVLLGGAL